MALMDDTPRFFTEWEVQRLKDLVYYALLEALQSPYQLQPQGWEQIEKHRQLLKKMDELPNFISAL